jgi:membrane associated rhomboid family serine protease
MSRRQRNRANDAGRPAERNDSAAAEGFDAYGVTRTVFAFAGMGALMGLLVGGTVLGFPIAISTTIVGGIAGGVLGRYVKTDL